MREQLIQYVELLFAGASGCEEIKQEILQNTLDRYDDLISEGKVPEAAYRLSIAGIGDINEILAASSYEDSSLRNTAHMPEEKDTPEKKRNRAIAIGLYIAAAVPLILLSSLGFDTLGLCLTLIMVAAATVLLIQNGTKSEDEEQEEQKIRESTETPLQKSINSLIWAVGLVAYLAVSISTGAWYITWLVFPIIGAAQGLVRAIFDLKGAMRHEN